MKRRYLITICMAVLALMAACGKTASENRPPIIDMHMHAFPATWSEEHIPFNVITGNSSTASTGDQLFLETLSQLDSYNIRLAVLSGPLANVNEWMAAAPGRFIGAPQFPMVYLNTDTATLLERYLPSIDELRKEHASGEIGAIGEITAQYAGMLPTDPVLEPFFALAEELDIPVGVHTSGGTTVILRPEDRAKFRVSFGNPIHLEEILAKHPGLRLYLMHAGYPFLQETIALMVVYPQVYADLSSINWRDPRPAFYAYLKALIAAGLEKRLMFGSDGGEFPETIGMAIDAIESADFLTEEQKRDIFYNNAARFLRLEGAQ